MSSPRAQLKLAVGECLQRILVADGYHTNGGQYFTDEPGQIDESAVAVIAVVIERQTRPTEPAVRNTQRFTEFAVLAKVPSKLDAAQDALDQVIDDIERAMADQHFRYPDGISFPQYVSMQPIVPDAGQGWVGATVRYSTHLPIR